jgi:hypothetical protein
MTKLNVHGDVQGRHKQHANGRCQEDFQQGESGPAGLSPTPPPRIRNESEAPHAYPPLLFGAGDGVGPGETFGGVEMVLPPPGFVVVGFVGIAPPEAPPWLPDDAPADPEPVPPEELLELLEVGGVSVVLPRSEGSKTI